MQTNKSELITKLDAARRQFDTAIQLWFQERDTVSVLTLAASAHQVIHDLNIHEGGEDLLFDNLNIKDEFRSKWVQMLKKPWNFCKHADQDPAGCIELDDSLVIDYFLFSAKGLRQLGCKHSQMEIIFLLWFGINRPDCLLSQEKFRRDCQINEQEEIELRLLPRSEFFRRHHISANI